LKLIWHNIFSINSPMAKIFCPWRISPEILIFVKN
jgi:hypothetical protein